MHTICCVYYLLCLQPNLLTAAADDRWKAIRKAVAVSFSAQVRPAGAQRQQLSQQHSQGHKHSLGGGVAQQWRSLLLAVGVNCTVA